MERIIALLLFICMIGFSAPSLLAQTAKNEITDRIVSLHQNKLTLNYALSTLENDGVPIGFEANAEWDVNDSRADLNQYILTVDFKGKLKDLLDLIIKQYPNYKWEVQDEVINIVPVNKRDAFVEKFLNTRVNNFTPKLKSNFIEIRELLFSQPEVKVLLNSEQISAVFTDVYSPGLDAEKRANLTVSNITIRNLLNKSIKEDWNKFWFVERRGKNKEYIYLMF